MFLLPFHRERWIGRPYIRIQKIDKVIFTNMCVLGGWGYVCDEFI